MPKIGFGTWQLKPADCEFAVYEAIKAGYHLIDTAQAYKNEEAVGSAIKKVIEEGIVSRKELIVATKVDVFNLRYKKAKKTTYESLRRLQLEYVDLLYVHWPFMTYSPKSTLKAFQELYNEGITRTICVSNFPIKRLKEAERYLKIPIFANQVECHPLLQQDVLSKYLQENNIHLVAYSPLGRGRVFSITEILEIAEKHNSTPAQVALAWSIRKGFIPIPKATSKEHILDNLQALNIELDEDDMLKIKSIEKRIGSVRLLNPPLVHPKWD